jgi:hypothetical protein
MKETGRSKCGSKIKGSEKRDREKKMRELGETDKGVGGCEQTEERESEGCR